MGKLLSQTPMLAPPGWRAVFCQTGDVADDELPYFIEPVIAFVANEHNAGGGGPSFVVWVAACIGEMGRLEPVDDDRDFVCVLRPDENPSTEELAVEASRQRTFAEKLKEQEKREKEARTPWHVGAR